MRQELHLILLTRKQLQDLFTQSVLPEVVGYVNLYCIAWQSKALKGEASRVIGFMKALMETTVNRPFYSCRLGDLAPEWQRGWS